MTMSILVALVCAIWLVSCAASVLALYWNARARRRRAALVSSCAALLIAYGGLARVRLSASKTVNGAVQWSVDSRWFFIAALILGAAALALTLWNWKRRSSGVTDETAVQAGSDQTASGTVTRIGS